MEKVYLNLNVFISHPYWNKMLASFNIHKKGFTLIELVVVIAVIGFMVAAAAYSINISRMKSRDAKRLADMTQIEKALELYYHDHNAYPVANAVTSSSSNWNTLQTALAPYIKNLPKDPLNVAYVYYYDSDPNDNNKTYGIMARLEFKSNYPLAANDGGYYSSNGQYYEKGNQVSYCKQKYTGSSANWWGSQTTICVGGD